VYLSIFESYFGFSCGTCFNNIFWYRFTLAWVFDNVFKRWALLTNLVSHESLDSWLGLGTVDESFVQPVKWQTVLFAFILWPITGFGITAGAHRLWAHRSYEAAFPVKFILMLFTSVANQGSIWHWARDHRTHHLHSDTDCDPHNIARGKFYAHMGWLLVKKPQAVIQAGRKQDLTDLIKDPLVTFQEAMNPWWNLSFCFALPAFMCRWFWGDTLWNGFLIAGVLRYVFVLHCTWSVNSYVHNADLRGPSPYDPTEPPAESLLVSILAMGEGWHSWHHAFGFDYAASELGCFQQWNPTKLVLDVLARVGLIWNRKRGHRMWTERKKRMCAKKFEEEGLVLRESLTGPPLGKKRRMDWVRPVQPEAE